MSRAASSIALNALQSIICLWKVFREVDDEDEDDKEEEEFLLRGLTTFSLVQSGRGPSGMLLCREGKVLLLRLSFPLPDRGSDERWVRWLGNETLLLCIRRARLGMADL
jgi:hypothetical protein